LIRPIQPAANPIAALARKRAEIEAELERVKVKLYPAGFSAARFAEVIESERVWALLEETRYRAS